MIDTNRPENTILGMGDQLPLLSLNGKVSDINKRIVFCDGNGKSFAAEWRIMSYAEDFRWELGRARYSYKLEYSDRGYYLFLPGDYTYRFLGASWVEAATALKINGLATDVTIQSRVADALEASTNQTAKPKPNRNGSLPKMREDFWTNNRF